MPYQLIKNKSIDEYKQMFISEYCNNQSITTFDNIKVKFYPEDFDHAFYTSSDWIVKDKSVFSTSRAEKILWIKEALNDGNAILKQGWDNKRKQVDPTRRVAVVNKNYIVVIKILNSKARFITAYVVGYYNKLRKILSTPDWQ